MVKIAGVSRGLALPEADNFKLQLMIFEKVVSEIVNLIVESAVSGEGTGVWFYSKVGGKTDKSAYVHFFFPANSSTVELQLRG